MEEDISRRDFLETVVLNTLGLGIIVAPLGAMFIDSYKRSKSRATENTSEPITPQPLEKSQKPTSYKATNKVLPVQDKHEGMESKEFNSQPASGLERKLGFRFNSSRSLSPSISYKDGRTYFSKEGDIKVTENGKPVAGIYFPTNYVHEYDGGWRVTRPEISLHSYSHKEVRGPVRKLDLTINGLVESPEFRGLFPVPLPVGALPSSKFVQSLKKEGNELYIDDIGRMYSTKKVNKLSIDLHKKGVRLDRFGNKSYSKKPEDMELNLEGKEWAGVTINQRYIINFTPTFLRKDGKTFMKLSRLKSNPGESEHLYLSSHVLPFASAPHNTTDSGPVVTIHNSIGIKDFTSLRDRVSQVKSRYIYPPDNELTSIAEEQYENEKRLFYIKPEQHLNLLEFLNTMPLADCDVVNTELMLRLRYFGHKTRLGLGFFTKSDGTNGNPHGWCETLVDGKWQVTDATPTKGEIYGNAPRMRAFHLQDKPLDYWKIR